MQATVNLLTERAQVVAAPDVPDEKLVSAVEAAGYTAQVKTGNQSEDDEAAADLRPRLIISAVLTVPLLAITMLPALRMEGAGWSRCCSRFRS